MGVPALSRSFHFSMDHCRQALRCVRFYFTVNVHLIILRHQHNLPPLVDAGVINALTGPQATAYLVGYGRPVPNVLAARRKAVRLAVGCTAEM